MAAQTKMLPGHASKFLDALATELRIPELQETPTRPKVCPKAKKFKKAAKNVAAEDSYVVCIVDCSGSMVSIGKEVKDGFNAFIKEQSGLPGKCLATVVKFNDKVRVVHHGVDIQRLPEADSNTFKPEGTTALHDAICKTIVLVKNKIASLARKPARVIVMLLTDGYENASAKYTNKDAIRLIKQCEELSWTFTFIGANQDAIAAGTQIGFKADNCLSYTADGLHASETWNNMSANCRRQRCGESSAWKEEERASSISDDGPFTISDSLFIPSWYS